MARKVYLVRVLIAATVLMAAVSVVDLCTDDDNAWTTFKQKYKKSYKNEMEDNLRRAVFHENQRNIEKHNELYEQGFSSYKVAMNQFGDMLYDEYIKYMHAGNETLKRVKRYPQGEIFVKPNHNFELPDFMDWRKNGAVSPVQDQGLICGSCYAFSAIGALEGQLFKKTGVLIPLSAQYLIDCTQDYGNLGCDGGSVALTFQFVKDNRELAPEENYSYEGTAKECLYNSSHDMNENMTSSFVYINVGDENDLKIAVATVGPLSAAIDGSHDNFRFYSEGIYYQHKCSHDELDHAILIVGYGKDNQNQDYWLVKNSWGTTWGEAGYMRIARNRHNHCGIAQCAIYPII